jgi:hypothetical protein
VFFQLVIGFLVILSLNEYLNKKKHILEQKNFSILRAKL